MQPLLLLIGLLAALATAQDDCKHPVLIKLQPLHNGQKFMKQMPVPKAVAPVADYAPQQPLSAPQHVVPVIQPAEQQRPQVQGVLNQAVLPPAPSVVASQQPVFHQGAPPGTQQFLPRQQAVVASAPPVTIPPDVQNQVIKYFGLDSFGIPGLTGNHPNGFTGAIQEPRAAGVPINGMPMQNAQAQGVTTQQDVLSQANPNFQNQLSQLNREVQNPGPYKSGGSIPLPADQPGENGLIGLLSTSIRKLVKDTGVSDALTNSLPSILGSQTAQVAQSGSSASSTGARAAGVPTVTASHQDDGTVTTHVSGENIRRKPSSPAQGVSQQLRLHSEEEVEKIPQLIQNNVSIGVLRCVLPRIPGIPLLPGGIPRNSQGQIDVVNLIGSITRRVSNGTTLADVLPPEQLQTLADNVTDALLLDTPQGFDLSKFMGRWLEGINSPKATEQRCVVHHYGGLTKNDKTATFTALKIYREGSEFGAVKYSVGYAFRGAARTLCSVFIHLKPMRLNPSGFISSVQKMDINTITGIISGLGKMMETSVDPINLPSDLIMGRWFQMYKAAVNFDVFLTQMYCPVAYFAENPIMGEDGFSMEEAYRVVSKTGPIETYKRDQELGCSWPVLDVYRGIVLSKTIPHYRCWTIIRWSINVTAKATEPIQYIIVTDANRLSLAVYDRDPVIFFQKYNKDVTDYMEARGFGGKVFWNIPRPIYQGPDCEWPSEKEVFARRVLKNQELTERSNNGTEEPVMSGMPLADIHRDPKKTLERLVGTQGH